MSVNAKVYDLIWQSVNSFFSDDLILKCLKSLCRCPFSKYYTHMYIFLFILIDDKLNIIVVSSTCTVSHISVRELRIRTFINLTLIIQEK